MYLLLGRLRLDHLHIACCKSRLQVPGKTLHWFNIDNL